MKRLAIFISLHLFLLVIAYLAQASEPEEEWTIDTYATLAYARVSGNVTHGDNLNFWLRIQDNCEKADGINEGEELEVRYRLSGRKWQRDSNSEVKWFLSAEAIDFEVVGEKSAVAAVDSPSDTEDYIPDDDVPF